MNILMFSDIVHHDTFKTKLLVHLSGQWMTTNCAVLPIADAGQYSTSHGALWHFI